MCCRKDLKETQVIPPQCIEAWSCSSREWWRPPGASREQDTQRRSSRPRRPLGHSTKAAPDPPAQGWFLQEELRTRGLWQGLVTNGRLHLLFITPSEWIDHLGHSTTRRAENIYKRDAHPQNKFKMYRFAIGTKREGRKKKKQKTKEQHKNKDIAVRLWLLVTEEISVSM